MTPRFTFERSQDWDILQAIATHPILWAIQSHDLSPKPEQFELPRVGCTYILLRDRLDVIGFWAMVPHSVLLWEVHMNMQPKCWGKPAVQAGKAMLEWLWEHAAGCERIIFGTGAYNGPVIAFARNIGFEQWGTNKRCVLKDGKLRDVVWMGASKPSALSVSNGITLTTSDSHSVLTSTNEVPERPDSA